MCSPDDNGLEKKTWQGISNCIPSNLVELCGSLKEKILSHEDHRRETAKVLRIMIETSNSGCCIYFTSTVFATCNVVLLVRGLRFYFCGRSQSHVVSSVSTLAIVPGRFLPSENEEELDDGDNAEDRMQQSLLEGEMREQTFMYRSLPLGSKTKPILAIYYFCFSKRYWQFSTSASQHLLRFSLG